MQRCCVIRASNGGKVATMSKPPAPKAECINGLPLETGRNHELIDAALARFYFTALCMQCDWDAAPSAATSGSNAASQSSDRTIECVSVRPSKPLTNGALAREEVAAVLAALGAARCTLPNARLSFHQDAIGCRCRALAQHRVGMRHYRRGHRQMLDGRDRILSWRAQRSRSHVHQ